MLSSSQVWLSCAFRPQDSQVRLIFSVVFFSFLARVTFNCCYAPQHKATCRQEYQCEHDRQSYHIGTPSPLPCLKSSKYPSTHRHQTEKENGTQFQITCIKKFICGHCSNYTFNRVSYSLESYAGNEKSSSPRSQNTVFKEAGVKL